MFSYQILASTIHGKNKKSRTKPTNLKHRPQHGMINFDCLMDHIMYQIFNIIYIYIAKKH